MQAAEKPLGRYLFQVILSQHCFSTIHLYVSPVTEHHRIPEHQLGTPDENVFKRTCVKYLKQGLLKPS